MRVCTVIGWALIAASPLDAQAVSSLNTGGGTDNSAQVAQAQQTANNALAAAQAAQGTANAAVTPSGLSSAIAGIAFPVTSVNGSQGAVTVAVPSLAGYATTANLTSALAPYATTSSVTSSITAATPSPCGVPLPDSLIGTAGTGSTCMPRVDASRPTVVQATTVVTASDGSFSGSWPTSFASAPTGRVASIEVTNVNGPPYKCDFIAGGVTASSFSGKCWQIVPTTLPSTAVALLGLVVSPIANAAGGLTVRIVGRQ